MRRTDHTPARWLHPSLACKSPLTLRETLRLTLTGLALGGAICLLTAGLTRGVLPTGLMSLDGGVPTASEPISAAGPVVSEIPVHATLGDADSLEVPAELHAELTGSGGAESTDDADRAEDAGAVRTFDGRPLRQVDTMQMEVTAYSPHAASTAPYTDGITASGMSVHTNGMRLVAADTDVLPMGTIISVDGYHDGEPVQVLDVGGAIKGKRLDVLYPTHERALEWGRQHDVRVTVWEYAD